MFRWDLFNRDIAEQDGKGGADQYQQTPSALHPHHTRQNQGPFPLVFLFQHVFHVLGQPLSRRTSIGTET